MDKKIIQYALDHLCACWDEGIAEDLGMTLRDYEQLVEGFSS